METIEEKVYGLPIFEDQLAAFTYSPAEDYSDWSREDQETHDGELRLKEKLFDSGKRAVSVLHRVENENIARYEFDVIDHDQRICRYNGEDTPPWSVFCAMTKYGYLCETAPEPDQKHIFGLLLAANFELAQRIQNEEYEYSIFLGELLSQILLLYTQIAAVEDQIGPNQMDKFTSLVLEDPSRNPIILSDIDTALSKMDVEDSYLPLPLTHPSLSSLLETYGENDESIDDSTSSRNHSYVTIKKRGRGEYKDKIYVSMISSDAIDRFSFEVNDEDNNVCVAQTGAGGDIPPYIVVDTVRDEFTVENYPSFPYDKNSELSDILLDVDQLVRRTSSYFTPESYATKNLLSQYLYLIDEYLSVIVGYEFLPTQYNRGIEQIFSELDIDLTSQNVTELSQSQRHNISAIAFQAVDNVDKIQDRERELHKITRIEDRWAVNNNEKIDTPLLRRLYDSEASLFPE